MIVRFYAFAGLALVLALMVRCSSAQGIISTVAGTGLPTYSGDGGPATSAGLNLPGTVAIDVAGNLYISDSRNYTIRKVTPAGIISTIAGNGKAGFSGDGGPAVNATLGESGGLAIDLTGNTYFTEVTNQRVRKVNANGIISTVAGNGKTGFSGDGGPANNASLNRPGRVATDTKGNIYISDQGNNRIRRVSPDGIITTFAGNGAAASTGDGSLATSASISNQIGVVVDSQGNLYIAENGSNRIRKVDSKGFISTVVGNGVLASSGDGGLATAASIGCPQDVGVDRSDTLYVLDSCGYRVRRVDSNGIISTIAGNGIAASAGDGNLATQASINFPSGIAIAPSGRIYIVDYRGNRVRTVGSAQQLLLSQSGMTFTGVAAGGAVPSQTFRVLNVGAGALNWTAAAKTLSGNGTWLSASAASGVSQAGSTQPPAVTVSADSTGLAAGDYYGQITVNAPGVDNAPQSVSVVLTVLASGSQPPPPLSPTGLIFVGSAATTSPGAQTVVVSNLTPSPLTFTTAVSSNFAVTPASGTVGPNVPLTLSVQPNVAGLAAGVRQGLVTLSFSDGSKRTVDLLLVLKALGTNAFPSDSRAAMVCKATKLLPLFTGLGSNFTVTGGWPASLRVKVADDCGNALIGGSVIVSFSNGDAPVSLISQRDGNWSGTWATSNASLATVALTADASTEDASLQGEIKLTGGSQINPNPPPQYGGLLSSASYARLAPVAPGTLVSIFGTNLADTPQQAGELPLPTTLGGAQVLLAGRTLPLLYVSDTQINAQIGYDFPASANLQLILTRGNTYSIPQGLALAVTQPGVFTQDQSGQGAGIVVAARTDGTQFLIGKDKPVRPGDALVIYCSGLGPVDQQILSGAGSPVSPLAMASNLVTVSLGGMDAQVFFAGLAPGFVGLYQVNAFVPSQVAAGDQPLIVTVGGQPSPQVTVTVAINN